MVKPIILFMNRPLTFSRTVSSSLFRALLLACLTVTFFAAALPMLANAQEVGVSITPARIDDSLDPGSVRQYQVTIRNLYDAEQTFYIFTRNIKTTLPGGAPVFAETNQEKTGYELADWILVETPAITLAGGESAPVSFVMTVPEDASPGGHYGGLFVSVDPPELEGSGAAVGYQVANILDIRVSGEAIEQANIRQFSTSKYFYGSQEVDFSVRIDNTGNVLVKPTGPLEVYNMLGDKVGSLTFNESQAGVFPGGSRTFENIVWKGDSIGFGRYEAILSPVYGDEGAKQTMSSTVTFWILPMNIIGPALGILALIILVTFFSVRIYIKRSLAHLQPGRRMVRQRRRNGPSGLLLFTMVVLVVTALFLIVLLALFA